LEVRTIRTSSAPVEQINIVPCGSAFSISPSLVLTAFHNVASDGSMKPMCLVRSLFTNSKVLRADIINLKLPPFAANEKDDWMILEREAGTFAKFAEICEDDDELPLENSDIAIKHFPVGLIDSNSVAQLRVISMKEKVLYFTPRLHPPSSKKQKVGQMKFTVTDNAAEIVQPVADVAFVTNGLSRGSSGAPYFALNNKVFAFHIESLDDAIENSTSGSHQSYCHGYVLCRLPSFMSVFLRDVKPTMTTSGP